MNFDLDKAVEQIKNNKDFLKLKKVIENNINHDNETTYDHCIKTYEVAQKSINGNFITNKFAKRKFDDYLSEKICGIEKRNLMQITALIHDIGKLIIFVDNSKKRSLHITYPDGTTLAPEHGFWGSIIVKDVVKDVGFSQDIIDYLAKCVKLHVVGFDHWLDKKLRTDELLWELKLRSENIHVEVIFNVYCDLYHGAGFKDSIHLPVELLNKIETYKPVKYSIMD